MHILEEFVAAAREVYPIRTFRRGSLLVSAGEIEKFVYWIEAGAVRAFFQENELEHTIRLGYTGNLITSLHSVLSDSPSEISLEVIRTSHILCVPKQYFFEFVHGQTSCQQGYYRMLEHLIQQQLEREIDLLIASPADRLARVLQRSPAVFQEIPLKYIAAYLRMSPETLSRIRKS